MSYEIIDGHKATTELSSQAFQGEASGQEVLASDTYAAIEYQNNQYKILHKYFLPLTSRNFTHYLKYFSISFFDLTLYKIKFHVIISIIMVVSKLAPH